MVVAHPIFMSTQNDMLGNRDRATFLTINADGKFVQSFKTAQEGTVSRENKNKRIVHEKFFDYVTGYIKSLTVDEHKDYGKQWRITMEKGDNKVIITLGYASNYAKPFLKMLPNIDLSKEVELQPSAQMVDGVKQTSLFIKQDGKNVQYAFKKDDGNGMPDRKLIKVKGKDQWDYSDQLEFLHEQANKKLGQDSVDAVTEAPDETTLDDITKDDNQDIPF